MLFPLYFQKLSFSRAKPNSLVGSVADLRTGGRWFDPRLGLYSFRGLMIVIATGFIPLSPLSVVSTRRICGKAASGLQRILCGVLVKRTSERMDRCTGRPNITEKLLQTALNKSSVLMGVPAHLPKISNCATLALFRAFRIASAPKESEHFIYSLLLFSDAPNIYEKGKPPFS